MARKANKSVDPEDAELEMRREYEEYMKTLSSMYKPLKVRHQYTTGLVVLDYFFNPKNPGLPGGSTVMFCGPQHSGKTGLALNIIKIHNEQGYGATYVDQENGLKDEYCENFGIEKYDNPLFDYVPAVDPDEIHIQYDFTYNRLKAIKKTQKPHVMVIDSIPAFKPKANFETVRVGGNNQVLAQWSNNITPLLSNSNVLLILINRVYDDIGSMYNDYKIPGGHNLQCNSDIITIHSRLANPSTAGASEVHSVDINKNFSVSTRQKLGIKIHKNKFHNCNSKISKLDYFMNSDPRFGLCGLDNANSMLSFLKDMGVLRATIPRYTMGDVSMFWKQWEQGVNTDPEINRIVIDKTIECLNKIFNDKVSIEE